MAKSYVTFETPKDLAEKVYNTIESVVRSGSVRKGTNEVTKAIERGTARLVVIAEDIEPEEIVMHLPILSKEKAVPFVFVPTKQELGAACGISVSTATVVIDDVGKAGKQIEEIVSALKALNK
ncbi:MAG: 50S ribosomal protein L7Ae [Candidatus Aenigmarchaeota archaeon]|nr:50S ribosomal protein L7Ae [Candidatus Aenigmarchaeota archaeon]MCK5042631.1 50S ribosomal protein L7Ae [Candidatus Aenigmarchaeota archaeon]MCK5062861.1 50S ribosomal protein L7Ae [Candidatus Aenigmarchaeota archaeon]MCK5234670.1 50S ribosomal protein L7Ae [Candidatus Aenigmarchaeota archaeon]MCK5289759.1 50S ribosomal protein L7Ae [Candidatus Aenigmarchaeota archaeon]